MEKNLSSRSVVPFVGGVSAMRERQDGEEQMRCYNGLGERSLVTLLEEVGHIWL